jgi:hypothetical protein
MKRREFLRTAGVGVAAMVTNLRGLAQVVEGQPRSARQPVLFIGHGSPMNIVRDESFQNASISMRCFESA